MASEHANPETAILAELLASGSGSSLPSGRREELVAFLTDLMVNRDRLSRYVRVLDAKLATVRPAIQVHGEIAADEITEHDFSVVEDAQLSALALDAAGLLSLSEYLADAQDEGSLGKTWVAAFLAEADRKLTAPGMEDWPARVKAQFQNLIQVSAPPTVEPPSPSPPKARNPNYLWWGVSSFAALAAAVLVGVIIGLNWAGNRPSTENKEVLLASASLSDVKGRGGAVAFALSVQSPRPGFATILVFGTERPKVHPDYSEDFLRVSEGTPVRYGPLEAPSGTRVFIIVTETPATEVLRKAISQGKLRPGQVTDLKQTVLELLWASGHRWAAVNETTVTSPP